MNESFNSFVYVEVNIQMKESFNSFAYIEFDIKIKERFNSFYIEFNINMKERFNSFYISVIPKNRKPSKHQVVKQSFVLIRFLQLMRTHAGVCICYVVGNAVTLSAHVKIELFLQGVARLQLV